MIRESYTVYGDGQKIFAKGQVSGEIIAEASIETADAVIQSAIDTAAELGGDFIDQL